MAPMPVCGLFRKNSYFCASGECPDEEAIPEDCTAACMVTNSRDRSTAHVVLEPKHCEYARICPCAHPASPRRKKAFEEWRKKKKHRDAVAKSERQSHRSYRKSDSVKGAIVKK